jgi:hypothetical protein
MGKRMKKPGRGSVWSNDTMQLSQALKVLAAVAIAFGLHVQGGAAYEPRTVGALALRLAFWSVVAGLAWWAVRPKGL